MQYKKYRKSSSSITIIIIIIIIHSVIHVFDTQTHKRLEGIAVENMEDPNDIAACTPTRQLYIADCRTDNPESTGCGSALHRIPQSTGL